MVMLPRVEHELHKRRRSRNIGLLVVLLAFAALVFGLSIVKITNGDMMEGFDHQPRASVLPQDPNPPAKPAGPVAAPGTPGARALEESP
ncbi:hypothetical protein [Paracoccus laeviglucosivorans]|uniref:Cytochrome C oxidase assembly protein n=1 Tax=Paracoccus laeviglucosivorans TaxID=1197861 RepID=A0A521CTM3_9RHOB|nr:hypothetical protein [Paracoccus laeviglucosivorans]SMO62773.1 hypothetical protein SAMN06265221_105160 [Paracoccus laeviglucosivorans]